MKRNNVLLFCFTLLLVACERYEFVDVNLDFKSKTVASLVVKADSAEVSLMLSQTTPIVGASNKQEAQDPSYITDAEVYLINRNVRYPFVYDTVAKRYFADLLGTTIKSGERYDLKVVTSTETVTGYTQVPEVPSIQCTIFPESVVKNGIDYTQVRISYTLLYPASANILLTPILVANDSSEIPLRILNFEKQVVKIKRGETVEQVFESYDYFPLPGYINRLKLKITSCDDAYSQYYNKYTSIDFGDLSSPFGQPQITYSNLSNGIGVMGSFVLADEQSFPMK